MFIKNLISKIASWFAHRDSARFSILSEEKKQAVLRVEAKEFIEKYGRVIDALANE